MVILEEIKSPEAQNVQWVVNEARKLGILKNLEEASIDNKDAVLVAKVRDVQPIVKGNVETRTRTLRQMLLREVNEDGTYGNKFKAVFFGDLAKDTESANLCIGDRLIFIQPFVVLYPMFEKPSEVSHLQVECGLPVHRNERIILIKKIFKLGCSSNESIVSVCSKSNGDLSKKRAEEIKAINISVNSNNQLTSTVESQLTESYPDKYISFGSEKVPARLGALKVTTNTNTQIPSNTQYVYKKLMDITEADNKVNVYVIVSEVVRLKNAIPGVRKTNVTFRAVDESCKDKQSFLICILFEDTNEHYKMIKPHVVLRIHRMKVEHSQGTLEGKVFRSSDIVIFNTANRSNSLQGITSAKTFTFKNADKNRVLEITNWLKSVYQPMLVCRDVNWKCLDTIKPDELFQLHCQIDAVSLHPKKKLLLLRVCDGTHCPLRIYQVPIADGNWTERAEHFKSNLKTVDVIVENPDNTVLKLTKGAFVNLGPMKLKRCDVDLTDPNCYKLQLQNVHKNIFLLDNNDPVIKTIEKRLTDNNVSQDKEKKSPNSDSQSNTQKQGIVREKRKLFNVNDNFKHSSIKRNKSESGEVAEITRNSNQVGGSLEDIRLKSPFEEDMLWNETIISDVYADKTANNKSSNLYPSKQTLNLRRKLSGNKVMRKSPGTTTLPIIIQLPPNSIEGNEESVKNAIINELKTKRIDKMSQESVDKYFGKLGNLLNDQYVLPKKPSTRANNTEDSPNETSKNVEVNSSEVSSVSSCEEVFNADNVAEDITSFNNSKCTMKNEDVRTIVLKFVLLPTGEKSRIVMKDNIVWLEMGDKWESEDVRHISVFSLFKNQLEGQKRKQNDDTSTTSEEDKDCPGKTTGKHKTKICESELKNAKNILHTDHLVRDESKHNTARKYSLVTNGAVKHNTINLDVNSKPNLTFNAVNNGQKLFIDERADINDGETVINEDVQNRKPTKAISVSSNTTIVKNNSEDFMFATDSFQSCDSVGEWLQHSNFSNMKENGSPYSCLMPLGSCYNSYTIESNHKDDIFNPSVGVCQMNVFIMKVEPQFKEDPMDLVSGYCYSGCRKLYLFSTLYLVHVIGHPLCPECYAKGKQKRVQLMFAFKLIVMDSKGNQLMVLLFREHAEQFLGCITQHYVNCFARRMKVIELLSKLEYSSNKISVPKISICINSLNSQIFASNTKILVEKR